MSSSLKYQFLEGIKPEELLKEHDNLLLENAKLLQVTDEKLSIKGTVLHYHAKISGAKANKTVFQKGSVDLRDIWVPGAVGWQHPVPILVYPDYAKVLIEIVDIYANRAKNTPTFVKTGVMSQINIAAQFIEYMCLHGHLSLDGVNQKQIDKMKVTLKEGGIPTSLALHERVNSFIDLLIENDELEPFLIRDGNNKNSKVTSIRVPKIAQCIGAVSLENQVPTSVYQKITEHLESIGVKVDTRLVSKGAMAPSQPAVKSLNNWFGIWNRFAKLDSDDQLSFIPFPNPHQLSKTLGKDTARTKNLDLGDVVDLLGGSHLWVYEYSSKIISLVNKITKLKNQYIDEGLSHRTITEIKFPEFLASSKKVKQLEKLLGIEIHKSSLTVSDKNSEAFSVTEVITLLMTACYVILQTYNARRQAEIQDPLIGITKEFFRCKNKKFNWYQACFYNEKNGERRWYTTNQGSTKAIQCLIKLKNAWDIIEVEGLFNVPNFRINEDGNFKHYKYNFNKGKDSKVTGNAFLKMMLGDAEADMKSHPFRRIYAVIYHYQYKNADLLALCHQLGHIDPDQTTVYVTEPASRDTHEQLHHKTKLTRNEKAESTIAIKEENKALDKVISEVGVETTAKDILALLMGTEEMAGKYTSYLKKVYRVLQKSVRFNNYTKDKYGKDFNELPNGEKSNEIAKVLDARGHKHKPKPHATCHKKEDEAKKHKAPCEPSVCKGCAYQEVKRTQLNIMKEDLITLKAIQADYLMIPVERMRAKDQSVNLEILIESHERAMERSKTIFTGGVS